jgi:hypothetical protein
MLLMMQSDPASGQQVPSAHAFATSNPAEVERETGDIPASAPNATIVTRTRFVVIA